MASSKNIRTCRYANCNHENKQIDITKDEYVQKGNRYYHKDCYKAKTDGDWKDDQTKADLQLIKSLWLEYIDDKVSFQRLFDELNALLMRGYTSDYLIFVMQYVIANRMKLAYPAGFKFYVDRGSIKEAYEKKKAREKLGGNPEFTAVDDESTAPKFTVKKKKNGFKSIFDEAED